MPVSGSRTRRRTVLVIRLVFLLGSLLWGVSISSLWPQPTLDPSWRLATNWALVQGLDFGSDVTFTYGPWGFLDVPSLISPKRAAIAVIAMTTACAVLWWRVEVLLRPCGQAVALAGASLVAVVSAREWDFSGTAVMAMLAYVLAVYFADERTTTRVVHVVAVFAALLVQVSMSAGTFAVVLVVLLALRLDSPRVLAGVAGTGAASAVVWWLLGGQDLTDAPGWARLSLELASGYAEGMAYTPLLSPDATYVLAVAGALVIAAAVLTATRSASNAAPDAGVHPRLLQAAGVLLVIASVRWAIQTGTTRDDQWHLFRAALVLVVLTVGLGWPRRPSGRGLRIVDVVASIRLGLALVLSWIFLVPHVTDRPEVGLVAASHALVDTDHRRRGLDEAASSIRAVDQMAPDILETIADRPVHVDPTEVSAAWAHDLNWDPVPIFQTYSAYTPALDEANARDLRLGDATRVVLREGFAIDSHNQWWESPLYNLVLVCRFAPTAADARWSLLERVDRKCGPPRQVSTAKVKAGAVIELPASKPNEVLTMSFVPDAAPLRSRLVAAAFHHLELLRIRLYGTSFTLSTRLAAAPLIVRPPAQDRVPTWPGYVSPPSGQVVLSRGGTLTFAVRTIE